MAISVRLTDEEENDLERVAAEAGLNKSEVIRAALRDFLRRSKGQTSFSLGEDLFGMGDLSTAPEDPTKKAIWEHLRDKHNLG